ncbi:MAG: FHA domain-containing protein [Pyrinomonadaceae bacterium]|nr:FHA domain-containing protein [Pyrinomonadaceae bacterium]
MPQELWLNFTDEKGEAKRVLVEGERFSIGRTPDNDLQIALGNLSRQHAKIERFADVFIVSDAGSSNGTFLNDERVENPVALKDGDNLNLGGGVDIKVELASDKPNNQPPPADDEDEDEEDIEPAAASASAANGSASSGGSSFPIGLLLLIPLLGGFFLLVIVGVLLIANRNSGPEVAENGSNKGFVYSKNKDEEDDPPANEKTPEKTETPINNSSTPITNSNSATPSNGGSSPQSTVEPTSTQPPSGDTQKVEVNSTMFLRRIAKSDSKIFLPTKNVPTLNSKINQLKGSSALAENLRNAKKSAAQIQKMAQDNSFTPEFLAIAAITKLGSQSGDVVATAQGMVGALSGLRVPVGNELANDSLLMIAAYEQGVAGQYLTMRDLLARECIPKNNPGVSCREIRTIWFLKENGKISDSQFEFALRFLAIGTIAQNPKDFGVQADPINLN